MRLIDADALIQRKRIKDFSIGMEDVIRATTIDAVHVVRCKNCRYCKKENNNLLCEIHYEHIYEDYFCASGIELEDKNNGKNGN